MKKSILFVMSLVLLASCTNKSFKVTGEVPEDVKYVYYTYNFFDEDPKLDSVAVADGKFVIEGANENDPVFVTGATDQNVQFWFVSEPGEIQISEEGMPSGTPLNDAIKGFLEKANDVKTEADLNALIDSHMKEHPNDLSGAFCLYLLSDYIGLNNLSTYLDNCGEVVNDAIHKIIPQEKFDNAAKSAPGKMFTDFEAEYEGQVQKLSDYVGKGKYVLVDFWASWCGPCMEEMPKLLSLYNKYSYKGLGIIGISLDKNKKDWINSYKDKNANWIQLWDKDGEVAEMFQINAIPHTIVVNQKGEVIGSHLRSKQLNELLYKILK